MVMRKNDSQSVIGSKALFKSSMVTPGIVPDGIPLSMVILNLQLHSLGFLFCGKCWFGQKAGVEKSGIMTGGKCRKTNHHKVVLATSVWQLHWISHHRYCY